MTNQIDPKALKQALLARGWMQADLASALGVSDAAVSQWLSGATAPRPATLVRLAKQLKVGLQQLLVSTDGDGQPLVAYRRKGQQITDSIDEDAALDQAYALEGVVSELPNRVVEPPVLSKVRACYEDAEMAARQIRFTMNVVEDRPTDWKALINWMKGWDVQVVPVFWGERENHGNALHVHFPDSKQTVIFVNLDSERLDFKFWLAHEIAHVLTPSLVGSDDGEEYADLFAGSLLFPKSKAAEAYREAIGCQTQRQAIDVYSRWAREWDVSLFTVYSQCRRLAESKKTPVIKIDGSTLHSARRRLDQSIAKPRKDLFGEGTPSAEKYLRIAKENFGAAFFEALGAYLRKADETPRFVQRCLHSTLQDAVNIHQALLARALE